MALIDAMAPSSARRSPILASIDQVIAIQCVSPAAQVPEGVPIPPAFTCPISYALMTDPVVTPAGMCYDRQPLEQWLAQSGRDPATGDELSPSHLYPNLALRQMIQAWHTRCAHPPAVCAMPPPGHTAFSMPRLTPLAAAGLFSLW